MKAIKAILFSFIFTINILPQEGGMNFLTYPRSISSMGLGQNSSASYDNYGALVYNPANLIFTEQPEFSLYHRNISGDPVNIFSGYFNIKNIGSFGVEYLNQSFRELIFSTPDNPDGTGEKFNAYNRSISLGFAKRFSSEFAAGLGLTYANSKFGTATSNHFFVSLGFNYIPHLFSNRLKIGFSLTNFSDRIEYDYSGILGGNTPSYDPPPSQINLGASYALLLNQFFSAGLQLAVSKYLITNRDENHRDVKPSFIELFTDWKDFPKDVNIHSGIFYEWKPLDMGNKFSFFQKFYLGNESFGPKSGAGGVFTHGAQYGIEYDGYRLTAGYSGIWHLVHNPYFIRQFFQFPMESFQFTFGINESLLFGNNHKNQTAKLNNITLSLGIGQSIRTGRYRNWNPGEMPNNLNYFLEGAFYINKYNALVSSISYSPIPFEYYYRGIKFLDTKFETFVFTSQYRLHPLEIFTPLYLQGGIGILRYNPQIETNPKYDYKSTLHLAIGGIIDNLSPIIINPEASYMLMFNIAGNTAPRLGGFNQFDLVLKLGYRF